jgi:hypothetical protein
MTKGGCVVTDGGRELRKRHVKTLCEGTTSAIDYVKSFGQVASFLVKGFWQM